MAVYANSYFVFLPVASQIFVMIQNLSHSSDPYRQINLDKSRSFVLVKKQNRDFFFFLYNWTDRQSCATMLKCL